MTPEQMRSLIESAETNHAGVRDRVEYAGWLATKACLAERLSRGAIDAARLVAQELQVIVETHDYRARTACRCESESFRSEAAQ